ncbi:MAG: glycosyltransferase family 4 protein [Casimicrobiaceae bacterium]
MIRASGARRSPADAEPRANELAWLFALPWDPRQPGGVDHVVLNLFRQMEAHDLYVPRMMIGSWEHLRPVASVDDGRPTTRVRLRSPARAARSWMQPLAWVLTLGGSLLRLHALLRTDGVRVVNVHFPGLWALQFGLVKRFLQPRLRIILSFHGLDIGTATSARGYERWLWRRLLRSADALVACSESLRAEVAAFDPAVRGKTVAIHNGLDRDAFLASADIHCTLDPRLEGKRFILSVAAFEPKKALDVLIRAFAEVVAAGDPDLLLVLVGVDRGMHSGLVELAAALGVGGRVITFINVPHARLHPFYRAARVFCLSSRSEPFGLVLLEAGAFALPVVASNVGGIPEVITHGETGRLAVVGDPHSFAVELTYLLARSAESARLGHALQRRVQERFTWGAAYLRYVALVSAHSAAACAPGPPARSSP